MCCVSLWVFECMPYGVRVCLHEMTVHSCLTVGATQAYLHMPGDCLLCCVRSEVCTHLVLYEPAHINQRCPGAKCSRAPARQTVLVPVA